MLKTLMNLGPGVAWIPAVLPGGQAVAGTLSSLTH